MVMNDTVGERLAAYPHRLDAVAPAVVKTAAARIAGEYGVTGEAVDRRCRLSVIRGNERPVLKTGFEKSAAAGANRLTEEYACYTVSALGRMAEFDPSLATSARMVICQNHAH
jgi:hypothetical protein